MNEMISGEGPWRVHLAGGKATRVEIMHEGRVIVVALRPYRSTCARCGTAIMASTPDNDDLDCCLPCEEKIAEEHRG